MTYPGWKRADRVAPAISVSLSYNDTTKLWRYTYGVANAASASQSINEITLRFTGVPQAAMAVPGWDAMVFPLPSALPGASFSTISESFLDVPGGRTAAPTSQQIAAGATASGFIVDSPDPPGDTRFHVRGYAAVPFLPDSIDGAFATPHDTTDSQRGWTVGPTRYTTPMTEGTQDPTDLARANRFLVFMNVDTIGTVLRSPAPIVLRFDNGSDGDLVCPETFRATLNGVDVTASFVPGIPGAGGAVHVGGRTCDNKTPLRAAIFTLGAGSPLVAGVNTLRTTVSGLPSTFGANAIPSVVDTDVITFSVLP